MTLRVNPGYSEQDMAWISCIQAYSALLLVFLEKGDIPHVKHMLVECMCPHPPHVVTDAEVEAVLSEFMEQRA